jgi:hypothetical protein
MCRSIKQLRDADQVVAEDEIRAAAKQFVRKISGFREPTSAHEKAFNKAVSQITTASQQLLNSVSANLGRKRT